MGWLPLIIFYGGNFKMEENKRVDVRAYPYSNPGTSIVGNANITIDGMLAISGVSIIKGKEGLFVGMPRREAFIDDALSYVDIAFPTTKELRAEIIEAVLSEYRNQAKLPADKRGYNNVELDDVAADKLADKIAENVKNAAVEVKFLSKVEEPQYNTLGFCSVNVCDVAITGVSIYQGFNENTGESYKAVSFPQKAIVKGQGDNKVTTYKDVAFPISIGLHEKISAAVLSEFDKVADKAQTPDAYSEQIAVAKADAAAGRASAEPGRSAAMDNSSVYPDR
jgi:DNA-binding cell septation regulator SpoVG